MEQRIQEIEQRNARVEAEKAWETSTSRIGAVCILTYFIAAGSFMVIGNDNPWRNAFIPVIGYFLSTLSLPFLKNRWMYRYNSIK